MRGLVWLGVLVAVAATACGSSKGGGSTDTNPSVALMAGFDPGPAPDPSKGFQIVAPIVHDIQPGDSVEYCTYTNITLQNDIWIKSTQGFQTETGHHVVIFYTSTPQPLDTHVCTANDMAEFNLGVPTGGDGKAMTMPGDLAVHIPAGVQIVLNHHYLNAGSQDVPEAQSAINVFFADPGAKLVNSGSVVVTNTSMTVPVGTSTYSVDCTVNQPYSIWQMAPHMHSWGTHISIDHTSSQTTNRIFDMDWQPDFAFDASAVLKEQDPSQPFVLQAGDKIHIQCDYLNTTNAPLAFGQEMCLFFGSSVDTKNIGNVMCDSGQWGSF